MDVEGTWLEHIDTLEMVSLFVAMLVLGLAVYRWLLLHWRSSVDLRAYAYLHRPFLADDGELTVRLEVLKAESIKVELLDASEAALNTILDGEQASGDLELPIDMTGRGAGSYYLRMTTPDQTMLKRFEWSTERGGA